MVPSEEVFLKLFNLEPGKKAWKQKKLSLDDFEDITGDLRASVCVAFCFLFLTSLTAVFITRFAMDTCVSQARKLTSSGTRMHLTSQFQVFMAFEVGCISLTGIDLAQVEVDSSRMHWIHWLFGLISAGSA